MNYLIKCIYIIVLPILFSVCIIFHELFYLVYVLYCMNYFI